MLFTNNRNDSRALFFSSWNKYKQQLPLSALESQIIDIIQLHPEYHYALEDEATYMHKNFTPEDGETNPFLHMGLHIAIREQVTTNLPIGIKSIYRKLAAKHHDKVRAEHILMNVLAENLWQAQRINQPLNPADYILACKKTLK